MIALSISCLFTTIIWIIAVAIICALLLLVIQYLGLPIPPLIGKLIVVLAVLICVWLLLGCLLGGGHPVLNP